MALANQLSTLEAAGLISMAGDDADLEYIFRHALVQEAAYDSLLKSERSLLHRAAGEALEKLYPDRLGELAPRLADHFWQAGEPARALHYYRLAAQNAARGFANAEAISLYSQALRVAGSDPREQTQLLQARGKLYDLIGDFERSRQDHEAALSFARQAQDLAAEWQSLVNLGFLWASRDYSKTGEYYRQAIALARQMDDQRLLAHSLNWLGNFLVNAGELDASRENHVEALRIFETLNDVPGIAETADLLGMSLTLGGDLPQAVKALDRARDLYLEIGDRRGAASVLATKSLTTITLQTDTLAHMAITVDEAVSAAQEGLRMAQEIGWRSGEVFCLATMCFALVAGGAYAQAFEASAKAMQMAEEIGHRQWTILSRVAAGGVSREIYDFQRARLLLERALELAVEIHSSHWTFSSVGHLASSLIAQGNLEAAQQLLDTYLLPDTPFKTLGQREVWCARAELFIEQGQPAEALKITDRLERTALNLGQDRVLIRPCMVRAKALTALALANPQAGDCQEWLRQGEQTLQAVLAVATRLNNRSRIWLVHALLARIREAQGRQEEAGQERAVARQQALDLAENIPDGALRRQFLERALAG